MLFPGIVIKDENEEAAKKVVRHCEALFGTFVNGLKSVAAEEAHLFVDGLEGHEIVLSTAGEGAIRRLLTIPILRGSHNHASSEESEESSSSSSSGGSC